MAKRFDDLDRDAESAYRANRNREAALLWAQAREVARSLGDKARAFQAGVWEAAAQSYAGEQRLALGLLLELLGAIPEDAPAHERWMAEKLSYTLWLDLRPRAVMEREGRLHRLSAYAAGQPVLSAGDLPHLRAELMFDCGRFDEALHHAEEAWAFNHGVGYFKFISAALAIPTALWTGRQNEAIRWRAQLAGEEQDYAAARTALLVADAQIALHSGASIEAIGRILAALEEDLVGTQYGDNADVRHLLARLWLLRWPMRDPEDTLHPARAALRARPESGRDFDRLLVIADFRLSSLRFALGVPMCDDLFYTAPQQIPGPLPPVPPLRLRRFQAALVALRAEASLLDRLLETDWYGTQTEARALRAAELLAASRS